MKKILVAFFALPLVLGCQIVGNAESREQLKEEVQASSEDGPAEVVQTMKPVICIEQIKLLAHLETLGEKPLAAWYNDTAEYPAMLLVNRDTGTVSVLEYLVGNPEDEKFEGLACLVSEGVKFKFFNDVGVKANYKINFEKTP